MTSLVLAAAGLLLAQADPLSGVSPEKGKRLFDGQCAVCHGIGGGGGTGPSLKRAKLERCPNNAALLEVIKEGIRGTQMPGAWQLSDNEAVLVAAYVRSLGKVAPEVVPGNAAHGAEVYRSAGCAGCHIVAGAGMGFGPELTTIGLSRGANNLKTSIVDPGADIDEAFLTVRLVTKAGKELKAMRVNEDSFTIQVRTAAGFQSFEKKDLSKLERLPKESLMPGYGKRLSGSDLDDLIAYLASLR